MATTTSTTTLFHPFSSLSVFLHPTKLSTSLLLLLPLLPPVRKPPLPAELWAHILSFALARDDQAASSSEEEEKWRWSVRLVCRWFMVASRPFLYADPHIPTFATLTRLLSHLHSCDAKWSPLHRSSHSIPGRYVLSLRLSLLPAFLSARQVLVLNAGLTNVWPLLPRLEKVEFRPDWPVCGKAVRALAEGCRELRVVRGLSWKTEVGMEAGLEDPVVCLLRACVLLEEVEIHGPGMFSGAPLPVIPSDATESPLDLPYLHTLSVIGLPSSPFLALLLHSPLPALRSLRLTSYLTLPSELCTPLLTTHGPKLRRLEFTPGPEWPSLRLPPPTNLLSLCPSLLSLTLIHVLPARLDPSPSPYPHPLRQLSLPRPTTALDYAHYIRVAVPLAALPELRTIRVDFRWLSGLGKAGTTGVRIAMMQLALRLRERGIELVDREGLAAPVFDTSSFRF